MGGCIRGYGGLFLRFSVVRCTEGYGGLHERLWGMSLKFLRFGALNLFSTDETALAFPQ
jgi:hypothetical protein